MSRIASRTVLSLSAALAVALALGACSPASDEAAAPAADATPTPEAAPAPVEAAPAAPTLEAVIAGDWRSAENRARDAYRRPLETLGFFGVQPDHTVIEITPGGGWYTEILAPWLRAGGTYVGAVIDPASAANERGRDYYAGAISGLEARFTERPDLFDAATLARFDPAAPVFGEPGSADRVLTFRNVHNWMMQGQAEGMFQGFFAVLKPGGKLGVVEHRANGDVAADDRSGYVGQAQVIAMAEAAGFVLEEASELNANPLDTKDYEGGVWTLPPVLREGEVDRERYLAIGESDRMTLRFVKPEAAAPAADAATATDTPEAATPAE